ncbi:MAG: DNA-3-methyladenine glycosylase I [Firmicutes bacterium]|nr:DNA-3-methyladenine glycosylase I [Bacillota bacterium]
MGYCNWDFSSEENKKYHDEEWGMPMRDDRGQFEFLMMEVMQCGLNWNMMIKKRDIFRSCFDNFQYEKIAEYGDSDIERIMNTEGMIRSKRKIDAIINNAKCFMQIRNEFCSFSNYLWRYSNNKTIVYNKHPEGFIPVSNGLSDDISKDLKKRGFKYLGTITIYSHLQACGIINDHDANCECFKKIVDKYPVVYKRRYLEKQTKYFGD